MKIDVVFVYLIVYFLFDAQVNNYGNVEMVSFPEQA